MTPIDPCPFCGGRGQLVDELSNGQGHDHQISVECTACRARGPRYLAGWDGSADRVNRLAVEAWNLRKTADPSSIRDARVDDTPVSEFRAL